MGNAHSHFPHEVVEIARKVSVSTRALTESELEGLRSSGAASTTAPP